MTGIWLAVDALGITVAAVGAVGITWATVRLTTERLEERKPQHGDRWEEVMGDIEAWTDVRRELEQRRQPVIQPLECTVCQAEAGVWLLAHPGLGFCGRHEPDGGWTADDGIPPLRDGTMTIHGGRDE